MVAGDDATRTASVGRRRSAWHLLDHAWEIEDRLGRLGVGQVPEGSWGRAAGGCRDQGALRPGRGVSQGQTVVSPATAFASRVGGFSTRIDSPAAS